MTVSDIHLVVQTDLTDLEKVIRVGIDQHAAEQANITRTNIGVAAFGGDETVGGVLAQLVGGSLSVRLLWVAENFRRSGVGRDLMRKLEEYARANGCVMSFVDTMSYQAPEFYPKLGYAEVARIEKFYAVGYDRIFFRKELA